MNNNDYDPIALLQKVPTATVSLQLSDLNTFSRKLIAQTREEYEREITGRLEARNEVYLTSDAAFGGNRHWELPLALLSDGNLILLCPFHGIALKSRRGEDSVDGIRDAAPERKGWTGLHPMRFTALMTPGKA